MIAFSVADQETFTSADLARGREPGLLSPGRLSGKFPLLHIPVLR
jgi:hypothetical protein